LNKRAKRFKKFIIRELGISRGCSWNYNRKRQSCTWLL